MSQSVLAWSSWLLTPEGAVVHTGERTAVIADVHLGYEWARGRDGDCVPEHSLTETLTRLTSLLNRVSINRLVVAGDLVESPLPCPRTEQDVRRLILWLRDRGVTLIALEGNHDLFRGKSLPSTREIDGWTIAHGHRPVDAAKTITGHVHPVLRTSRVTAPCFLVGTNRIVLPAFSSNAAGWNVMTAVLPKAWRTESLRCIAGVGSELLDFGPISRLSKVLSGA